MWRYFFWPIIEAIRQFFMPKPEKVACKFCGKDAKRDYDWGRYTAYLCLCGKHTKVKTFD